MQWSVYSEASCRLIEPTVPPLPLLECPLVLGNRHRVRDKVLTGRIRLECGLDSSVADRHQLGDEAIDACTMLDTDGADRAVEYIREQSENAVPDQLARHLIREVLPAYASGFQAELSEKLGHYLGMWSRED